MARRPASEVSALRRFLMQKLDSIRNYRQSLPPYVVGATPRTDRRFREGT
jgi:hypothetical protein